MGIESLTEQGIKTAFRVFTDALAPDDVPTYRCFWLDDETESGAATEDREYPLVQITAKPNWPTQYKSTFRDVSVEIKWATHATPDPKHAKLVALYEGCRAIIDTATTILVTGYNVIGIIIDDGGDADVDGNEQYITLALTVKLCGA